MQIQNVEIWRNKNVEKLNVNEVVISIQSQMGGTLHATCS